MNTLAQGLILALTSGLVAQEDVVETYDDGSTRCRYRIDANGRKHGNLEQFDPDGAIALRATYANGELHGRYVTYFADGSPRVTTNYQRGALHGKYREAEEGTARVLETTYSKGLRHGSAKVSADRKVLSKQRWKHGRLVKLDGIDTFERPRDELRAELARIETAPDRELDAEQTEVEQRRAAALRRLMAYRYLCRIPHEGMELVPEWNEMCEAASEVVARNGELSHTPAQPPGMPDDRYRLGYRGANSSNLSRGEGMIQCVDGFMDDSDASNIDHLGHRRWCLNPAMRRTGFGESGDFAAMWAFDASGGRAKGLDAVMYPPPGFVPTDYFGARHAWSIALLKGGGPKLEELEVCVYRLDDWYVKAETPLEIDHLSLGEAGRGTGPIVIFRPAGLQLEPGRAYLAEIRFQRRKRPDFQYVVEFCEPAKP